MDTQQKDGGTSVTPSGSSSGFECPNCHKIFGRDDLLRRHLAREARAQLQPSLDRQKSCFECARSKARCDLEVPTCGRCRKKGKPCTYAPRSGNPNLRKAKFSGKAPATGAAPMRGAESRGNSSHDSDEGQGSHRGSFSSSFASHGTWSESSGSITEAAGLPGLSLTTGLGQPSTSTAFPPHLPPPIRSTSPVSFHAPPPAQPEAPFARRGTSIMTQFDHTGRAFQTEDGEETPISRMVSSFTHRDQVDFTMQDDEANRKASTHPEPSTSNLEKLSLGPYDTRLAQSRPPSHRNLPPLITGFRMPGPGSASLRSVLPAPNPVDLGGWLDEPVAVSPLFRFGPYSALKTAGPFSFLPPGLEDVPHEAADAPILARLPATAPITTSAAPLQDAQQMARGRIDNQERQAGQTTQLQSAFPKGSQGAARHIWQHGIDESEHLPETLARAAAAHLITYPTLIVLPEPTSPVPPFIYRPWLASVRSDLPASLAIARVVLAGYLVRLPSSQSTVWESIAREMRIIISNAASAVVADDLELFASVAALWLYLVLAILTEEPAGSVFVDDTLVNAGLKCLSEMSVSLSNRIKTMEAQGLGAELNQDTSFAQWGLLETMRRTLFAVYTILVLQRFREGAIEIQEHLAGCDLVMDVALPASAKLFASSNITEWRIQSEEERSWSASSTPPRLTLRDLVIARKATDTAPASLIAFFDRHDEFTNVCLSVALGLDSDAM